jgi:thiamine biosynthesis lipoprotein
MRIALPAVIDAAALAGIDRAAPVRELVGETMGTRWRVLFASRDVDAAALHRAIVARLADLVAQMSHWAANSRLCGFNRAPGGSWTMLPPDFTTVMHSALAIAAATDGAFDPAIGALVDLWGHGPPGPMPRPDDAAIGQAQARSGWRRLAFDPATARLRQPGGVALDLSGIAKGHAVDAIVALLAEQGVAHMLVEVGGELAGRGARPDGEPWWVDLETPPGLKLAPLRIALHGIAVATSGSYLRGDHNLDPRTGRPAGHGVVSASVIAGDAMTADGWASALTVLGPTRGIALADEHRLAARIVTADGRETLSTALIAMLADD